MVNVDQTIFLMISFKNIVSFRLVFNLIGNILKDVILKIFQAVCDTLFLIFLNVVFTGVFHLSESQVVVILRSAQIN